MKKKMRDIKKKVKNFSFKEWALNMKERSIHFVMYNRQFLLYVLFSLISCSLLRKFTINDGFNIKAGMFDFSIIILLGSIGYCFKVKKQFAYWNFLLLFFTTINLINGIYFKFFSNFVTVGLVSTLGQTGEVSDAVLSRVSWQNVIYLIFPIAYLIIHNILKKKDYISMVEKVEISKKLLINIVIFGFICLLVNISTLDSKDLSRLAKQWNREYIVERYGVIIYQGNDIVQYVQITLKTMFGKEEAYEHFKTYYEENPYVESDNKYTDILKGYNVISIHLESIMNFLIGLKINGEEVTPNLNKLVNESMYFDNFYSEVSVGTSSDAEFTFNTSIMPVQSGTVFVSYYNRTYESFETLLAAKGYYTFSMHANKGSMWNRSKMHPSLGYMRFYTEDDYKIDEVVGLGLSDNSFFTQSSTIIEGIMDDVTTSEEYNNYFGTMIMLSNHTPWQDPAYTEGEDAFDITYHTGLYEENTPEGEEPKEIIWDYLKDEKMETIGRYIQAAHYADEQLGKFIEYVKESDKYNNTVFLMYGDHPAQIGRSQFAHFTNFNPETGTYYEEDDENYIDFDYYEYELFKKVPFIIWTPNGKIKQQTVSYPMGMIDVLPTVSNMLGIDAKYALGNDIFTIKNDNTVVFPNGNFLTSKVYYYSSKGDYRLLPNSLGNLTLDENYISDRIKYTEDILQVSNDLIVYDLIKEDLERSEKDGES